MLRERIISFIPMEYDLDLLIGFFNILYKEYKKEDIAKVCFEIDDGDPYLTIVLAIMGNKYTEIYLKQILKENSKSEDIVYYCSIGLAALGIDEGFEIIEKFLDKTHPVQKKIDQDEFSHYLEYINNPRGNKIKENINRGIYNDSFKEKKETIFNLFKSEGYDIDICNNDLDYKIDIDSKEQNFFLYFGYLLKYSLEPIIKILEQGLGVIISIEGKKDNYKKYLNAFKENPDYHKYLENIFIVENMEIHKVELD